MKRTLIAVAAMVVLSAFALCEVKIGIINAQKLLDGTKKGRAVAAKLEKIGKEKQAGLDALRNEIKQLEKDLMSPALNEATREKKALDLQNKRTDLKRFVEDSQREYQMMMQTELQKLQDEIKPIIQRVGREKGLTIILEITAVAYFDSTVDVTDDIMKIMDSQAPGK